MHGRDKEIFNLPAPLSESRTSALAEFMPGCGETSGGVPRYFSVTRAQAANSNRCFVLMLAVEGMLLSPEQVGQVREQVRLPGESHLTGSYLAPQGQFPFSISLNPWAPLDALEGEQH